MMPCVWEEATGSQFDALLSIGAIHFVRSAVAYERNTRMKLRPNILKGDPGNRLSV
ncbi:hypothetical protein ABIE85_008823 [Bradyrhizobium diazoefficiens]|jgi:hypothetical protein